jgi:enoyl-CoA hydratase/carnithine racemase
VAAVDGAATGFGCDPALACDVRLLSDKARFGEIYVKRGLMPDGGGTFMLPRLIGLGRAIELMLTGDAVDADEAARIGLGRRVAAIGPEFRAAAQSFAARIAAGPPLAMRAIKELTVQAPSVDLSQALERELERQIPLLRSADFVEGVSAFLAKREPRFQGK